MTESFHVLKMGSITNLEGRQQHFLTLQRRIRIVAALDVSAEESGKIDPLAAGAEYRLSHTEIHRQHCEASLGHLAGHRAFPDQFVKGQIPAIQAGLLGGTEALACGANRLMGLLRIAGLGVELPRRLAQILLAVAGLHAAASRTDGLVGEMH